MSYAIGSLVTGAMAVWMAVEGSSGTAAVCGFSCGWCAALGVASSILKEARNL